MYFKKNCNLQCGGMSFVKEKEGGVRSWEVDTWHALPASSLVANLVSFSRFFLFTQCDLYKIIWWNFYQKIDKIIWWNWRPHPLIILSAILLLHHHFLIMELGLDFPFYHFYSYRLLFIIYSLIYFVQFKVFFIKKKNSSYLFY